MQFKPTSEEAKAQIDQINRSEKKFENWRNEYTTDRGLYCNDKNTVDSYSVSGWRGESTIVTRNGIHANVSRDIRRLSVKDPYFQATADLSMIRVDDPEGNSVLIDGPSCAAAQAEVLTYGFKAINFEGTLPLVIEDADICNEGWSKLVTANGADTDESEVWVKEADEDQGDDGKPFRVKARRSANSLANARFPGIIHVDPDDVVCDCDAVTVAGMTWIAHRIKKPIANMRSQEIDDYTLTLDPKTNKLVYKTVMEADGVTPKRIKKYKNLEGLTGNWPFYQERIRQRSSNKKGDFRNEDLNTNEEPKDYLVWYEVERKFPADSKIVVDEFGGVPNTIDGNVRAMWGIVESTDKNGEGPTEIFFRWCPVDIGGFALKRMQLMPKSSSQKGFSRIRNYREAVMWENYWDSYDQRYHEAMIPQTFADEDCVNAATVKKSREEGGIGSMIFGKTSGGKSMSQALFTTQFEERAPVIGEIKMRMRGIQDEAAGQSANQRMTSGANSATEASLIQQNTDDQLAFDIRTVKRHTEELARGWMFLFVAQLPESGHFEIPGSEGGYEQMDRMQFLISCGFTLSLLSFNQATNPVEVKQFQEFMMGVTQTPQQMWKMMKPLWRLQASKFSPAARAAYMEFEKEAFGEKSDSDPDVILQMLREGLEFDPDPEQDFVQNIPKLKDMLVRITEDDKFAGWNDPVQGQHIPKDQQGKVPRTLLSGYLAKSEQIALTKGLGPQLGLSGDKAGQTRKSRGSGQGAGRASESANPSSAEIESGAEAGAVPAGMGSGMGG